MFQEKLRAFQPQAYAVFRIVLGLLFFIHGTQKLFGFPVLSPHEMPPFIKYGAGGIELLTGFLVMIGLFTQLAAFLASGTMAVGYWMAHGLKAFWPIENGGELAVAYCFAFLLVATQGAGIWSFEGEKKNSERAV